MPTLDIDWQDDALCFRASVRHGYDVFFDRSAAAKELATNYCRHCPVVTDCLEWGMKAHIEFGVLGGATPQQRGLIADGRVTRLQHLGWLAGAWVSERERLYGRRVRIVVLPAEVMERVAKNDAMGLPRLDLKGEQ